jgi:hypothetical protein
VSAQRTQAVAAQAVVHSPKSNAEFVCQMEEVLEVYTRPYDERRPQVCLDETSKQLMSETRVPLPLQPGQPECCD